MRAYMSSLLTIFLSVGVGVVVTSCGDNPHPFAADTGSALTASERPALVPGVEVAPVYRIATGRPSEWATVYVFYARGGNGNGGGGGGGGKPKPDDPPQTCDDPNTNEAYVRLVNQTTGNAIALPETGFPVEYHPAFEPSSVAGVAFGALDGAFEAWRGAAPGHVLPTFGANPSGSAPPARDEANVVGWRRLVGKGAGSVLAATYIWDDGATILEADIFYNTKHEWAANSAIAPGSTLCGEAFEVQAIGVHEVGHMIGLGHVADDGDASNGDEVDATMFGSASKGELQKQTLTPGGVMGLLDATPSEPAI